MFTKICIENFKGILNKIEFNFIAKSRNKDKQICLYKTYDGIYINKLIGILAGNASGKTTIIDALATLGNLMVEPIMLFDLEEEKNNIMRMIRDSRNDLAKLNQRIEKMSNSVCLEVQHVSGKNKDTCIQVEMYIEENELSGYYKYMLQFNAVNKKITTEKFTYRKNYKSKEKEILDLHDISECQLYYINRYYDNMMNLEMVNKESLEEQYKFIKTFLNHYINDSKIVGTKIPDFLEEISFLNFYKKNPQIMEQIIKIVDPKINSIQMKPDSDEDELIYELKTGGNITRKNLSTGTKRFLSLVFNAMNVIKCKGVLLIDEIEENMHKELIFLILRLFVQLDNNSTQIIFSTNLPEIFDCINEHEQKLFKQDSIYLLNNINGNVEALRMSEIKIKGKRIKGDALVSTIYKKGDISVQPNKREINEFLKNIK